MPFSTISGRARRLAGFAALIVLDAVGPSALQSATILNVGTQGKEWTSLKELLNSEYTAVWWECALHATDAIIASNTTLKTARKG